MASGGILKQPLLWFAIIGLLLFIADSQLSNNRSEIIIDAALRDRLGTLWTTQTGLIASEAELDALTESWLREEVMYQEALRLGLDQEDSIVRRRLVQKLGFIAESEPLPDPEIADLEYFYQENIEDYTLPLRYSFQQKYFQAMDAAENALAQIIGGMPAENVGETSMLNQSYAYRSALDLNATFGAGFADRIANLSNGIWDGPIQSGFGYHLIFISAIHPEQVTPLQAIPEQVLQDFQRARQLQARDSYIDNLLDEYEIIMETQ
ncbi:MAG: peptidylprolyl isomerase [Gammaproteobacteria bacterium]|nr:peptidylprolyl isomerase [Gammaproteobacteria bacterium]MDD9894583.1 peptidylprolyl isomerase [Gammaproteobacteria bacterium]MDD9957831.1 peptidylprolyl isomerase [Gammaproteobacteria bacterium]